MDIEKDLLIAERLLEGHVDGVTRPETNRLDATLGTERLVQATRMLVNTGWGYLAAVTGLDLGVEAGEFEVLYHFCAGGTVVTLRVRTPRSGAAVPSLCEVVPSAGFFERELAEMFGITVEGTPDDSRLFMPDVWPAGAYPLRKDFSMESVENIKGEGAGQR